MLEERKKERKKKTNKFYRTCLESYKRGTHIFIELYELEQYEHFITDR